MANIGGGYMGDYDVIPVNPPKCPPMANNGNFTTYCPGNVPGIVSGSAAEFLRVAKLMAALTVADDPQNFQNAGTPLVSDMFALQHLARKKEGLVCSVDCNNAASGPVDSFSRAAKQKLDAAYCSSTWAVHVSHRDSAQAGFLNNQPQAMVAADKFRGQCRQVLAEQLR